VTAHASTPIAAALRVDWALRTRGMAETISAAGAGDRVNGGYD
jgi:hypothetical protein